MDLIARYHDVLERIARAEQRRGAGPPVTLVAVSKTVEPERIHALWEAGQREFGENYVQEWRDKVCGLPEGIRWHFIGGLQSNKAKYLVDKVALIESVDRASLAEAISARAGSTQDVLLQINTGNDEAKGGVELPEVDGLLGAVDSMENVRVRGLMTIPPFDATQTQLRGYFSQMREAFERLAGERPEFDVLSMGMTSDFEWAIEEGATHVRVGTAIFGRRG